MAKKIHLVEQSQRMDIFDVKHVHVKCGVFHDAYYGRHPRLGTGDRAKVTCKACNGTRQPMGRKRVGVGPPVDQRGLTDALRVIYQAVRSDETSEYWTLRKYLDDHNVFNDDLQDTPRLIEAVCKLALRLP